MKTAGILLMQAVPLTLVMFVFFPRVAPLWSVPLPGAAARSGISDSMTPGQVAKLGLSEELAFRVEFDGPAPARKDLYWRVLTFSHYENGTWSGGKLPLVGEQLVRWSSMRKEPNWLQVLERKGQAVPYAVIAEPSHQPWLFALDLAEPLSPGLGLGRDFRVLTRKPVTTRIRYEIESWSGVLLDPVLPDWLRKRETRVPASGEARTRALVQQLWSGDAQVFMDQVLDMFRNQPFFYTLTPPVLQESDQIDQFLFDTRRGFCAHYAGAFVYMMRLAGLPARVVAGYQGGVPNPMGDHILVRQYDAHAWAEVWLADRGWVRVDPTAAVAPERIEQSVDALRQTASQGQQSPFPAAGVRGLDFIKDALYLLDSLEYRWNSIVLTYDTKQQSRLLADLLGDASPARIALSVFVLGSLAMALATLGMLLQAFRNRRAPVIRAYAAFLGLGRAVGLPLVTGETPAQYARRLAHALPSLRQDVVLLAAQFDQALFHPDARSVLPGRWYIMLWRLRRRLLLAYLWRLAGVGVQHRLQDRDASSS